MTSVTDLAKKVERSASRGPYTAYTFGAPDIQLHCGNDSCNSTMFFRRRTTTPTDLQAKEWHNFYIGYRCANCQKSWKTFSLGAYLDHETSGTCYKFGEIPEYGPPTAARLIKLIGPDRGHLSQGSALRKSGTWNRCFCLLSKGCREPEKSNSRRNYHSGQETRRGCGSRSGT